ncbi:MDR family MFS transporter [Nocardia sp. NBC_01388]|uniref:MDR family MFS transporter n=1 Tax=Nocardia sp. NBC_01388 TaxID=2903596 RepID=UPI00324A49C6
MSVRDEPTTDSSAQDPNPGTSTPPEPPPALTAEAKRVIVVVLLGAILAFLDATVVNVALHNLSVDFDVTLGTVQWVVTSYLLALAAVIPMSAWLIRRFGAARMYTIALAVFVVSSLLCGLAHNVGTLIAFRALQGIGGGLMMPVGQAILVAAAGQRGLARAMSAIGIPMVLTPVIGPTVGGLLLAHAGWQWIFWINVPIGIIGIALAVRMLPPDTPQTGGRLDLVGLLLLSGGATALTYGLTQASERGSARLWHGVAPAVAGLALIAAFAVWALRARNPLLNLRIYRNGVFASASVAVFAMGAATFGGMILMPLYYQVIRHDDAVTTGMLLAPQGLGAAVAMFLSGRLFEKIGSVTAVVGGIICVAATIPFIVIGPGSSYWLLSIALVVRGFGLGMAGMPAMTAALRAVGPDEVTDATPILNMLQRVGGSVGTALFVVVLQQHLDNAGTDVSQQASAFGTAFIWVLAATVLATLPAVFMARIERTSIYTTQAQ